VDSAVVRMIPWRERPFPECDPDLLGQVVTAAFAMRRKTLKNTLHAYLKGADFEQLGIDPGLRAENLGVQDYVRIVIYLGHEK
jgi:16S rRNA (adenine1518-N6/adenine1519-N6)-dimethyltransferase